MRTGRTFKVVMLPTTKASGVRFFSGKLEAMSLIPKESDIEYQHLHIISNDEINEGDTVLLDSNVIYTVSHITQGHYHFKEHNGIRKKKDEIKKIIASTDKAITPHSWIANSFWHPYIQAYNAGKPITEVNVETLISTNGSSKQELINNEVSVLKTREDGSIFIHQSKVYSSEEVRELLNKANHNGYWLHYEEVNGAGSSNEKPQPILEFIEQTLNK